MFDQQQVKEKAYGIMGHPHCHMLPPGRCLCLAECSANQDRTSFVPAAVRLVKREENSVLFLDFAIHQTWV